MCTCWLRILDWKVDWWYFRLISKNNHNDFRYFFGRIHRWSIDLNRTPVSVEVINPWISSPSHHHFNYVSASHRGSGLSLPIWNTLFIFCFLCDWLLGHGLNWFLFLGHINLNGFPRKNNYYYEISWDPPVMFSVGHSEKIVHFLVLQYPSLLLPKQNQYSPSIMFYCDRFRFFQRQIMMMTTNS